MDDIIFYHGSQQRIEHPDLSFSREDIDFGAGFYLTNDKQMAEKWACTKRNSVVSNYTLEISNLNIYFFDLDEEWLKFVTDNRMFNPNNDYTQYDVLVGPTADDKLYDTLQDYLDGYLSVEQTLKYLNIAGLSNQFVLKTDRAISQLKFKSSYELSGLRKDEIRKKTVDDRKKVIKELEKIKKRDLEIRKTDELKNDKGMDEL